MRHLADCGAESKEPDVTLDVFKCKTCSKVFALKVSLETHEKYAHETYECEICEKGFKTEKGFSNPKSTFRVSNIPQCRNAEKTQEWDINRKPTVINCVH